MVETTTNVTTKVTTVCLHSPHTTISRGATTILLSQTRATVATGSTRVVQSRPIYTTGLRGGVYLITRKLVLRAEAIRTIAVTLRDGVDLIVETAGWITSKFILVRFNMRLRFIF